MLGAKTIALLLFLHKLAAHLITASAYGGTSLLSSQLRLHVGLNLSISNYRNSIIPTVPDSGFFFPLVSSLSFTSNTASEIPGFSLGFYKSNDGYLRLAVCGGLPGNHNYTRTQFNHNDADHYLSPYFNVANGSVVPLWISPLTSVNSSLVVVLASHLADFGSTPQLQLRDYNGSIVWQVSNVGMLEMQDTGNLLIYSADNTSDVVWQSSIQPTDTLFQGRKLEVGMSLSSNNLNYSAKMESGGLVLYFKSAQMGVDPAPYWVLPVVFRNISGVTGLKDLVFSPPCSNYTAYIMLGKSTLKLFLEPGMCNPNDSYIQASLDGHNNVSWSFMRLENDGRLYAYAVMSDPTSLAGTFSIQPHALDSTEAVFTAETAGDGGRIHSTPIQEATAFFSWGGCDVPLACGPLAVCTPGASNACACASTEYTHLIDITDSSKGCAMRPPYYQDLCQVDFDNAKFVKLENMASIFLFNGWAAASNNLTVEDCQQKCKDNCSCSGFIYYQADTSACFYLRDDISLINVTDRRLESLINISDPFSPSAPLEIQASNYIMYLKVWEYPPSFMFVGSLGGIIILVLIGFIGFMFLVCVVSLCLKARRRRHRRALEAEELRDILPLLPSRYWYKDLHKATTGFSKLLGAGGCGSVYAGELLDGRKVAVKILEFIAQGAQSKLFLAEVATVGRTNHFNVVRLVGFCWEVSHRLLVYEYVERGSLDQWLFVNSRTRAGSVSEIGSTMAPGPPLLDWKTRYNIALDVARGLSYLHEECTQPILHFDIKPQNILLDNAFVAKLADFGMSRLMDRGVSEVLTRVRGTPGYIAPEWLSHGAVSKKSDVYSMGMVMLEIIGGRRNVDLAMLNEGLSSTEPEKWHFPSWAAKMCKKGLMMELVDERLHTCGFDAEQVLILIYTAFWCIQEEPGLRPSAATVVQWLEGSSPVGKPSFNVTHAHDVKSATFSR